MALIIISADEAEIGADHSTAEDAAGRSSFF